MSKKSWYFAVLISLTGLIVVAAILNISSITTNVVQIKNMALDFRIVIPAIICAFIFTKYNPYWMVMAICALGFSAALQAYYASNNLRLSNDLIFLRAMSFLIIVYIVDYARVMFSRK